MTLSHPCIRSIGPTSSRIVFLGEAPGESEEREGIPFVGHSGRLLDEMAAQADLPPRSQNFYTNVLLTRPPQNKLEAFCVPKKHPSALAQMPSLLKGLYLRNDFLPELERLRGELRNIRPNLIVALGNTACWATIRQTAISKIRGTVVDSEFGKVLPTYHPAAIFRQWELRPTVIADLMKAKYEMGFPEVRRPQRIIEVNPSFEDIERFISDAATANLLAIDIETKLGQITCIGFARSRSHALVIPFVNERNPDKSHWRSTSDEVRAYSAVQRLLALPVPKVFQNGLYDLQYIRRYRWQIRNCLHDTMLLHHSLHPELLKGLGFMGSVYTNEPAWKLMRKRGDEQLKREDE